MSAADEFCSQNMLDNSIPFIAPEPYTITQPIINQIAAIVDRDVATEGEALIIRTVDMNRMNKGFRRLSKKGNNVTIENIIGQKYINPFFNNVASYRNLYRTISESNLKTYAKHNFIRVPERFINKGTNFNTKPRYTRENARLALDELEALAIKNYTRHGDGILNGFLIDRGRVSYSLKINPILEAIERCFRLPRGSESRDEKIHFIFFKILYNTIAKIKAVYHPTDKYVRVFRGVKNHYLGEEPNKVFYTNSFLSTSYSIEAAEGFGFVSAYDSRKDYEQYNIDVFYVHPSCLYCNMLSMSSYGHEKEILITPYCRYVFIKKQAFWTKMRIRGGMPGRKYPVLYTKNYYAVFPTDLPIPANFEAFYEWIQTPLPAGLPIEDAATGERVVVNVLHAAPEVACTGAGCASMGGYTRRRKSKKNTTRKYKK
jgi:hypothetical protein